jgi:DNA modification methylase
MAVNEIGVKPYYRDESVTLYHGDCRAVLPALTEPIDLLLTDPPYGVNWQSNTRREKFDKIAGDDGTLDVPAVLTQACRLLRVSRHAYVFGAFDLTATPLTAAVHLVWDKQIIGAGNLSLPWGPAHEPITFAVHKPSQANKEAGRGNLSARLRKGSVLRAPRPHAGGVTRHPTEKPVSILREMIESSSVLGETVLDPFAGSGSTLVAAMLEGRRAIGIELDERYCETTAQRLQQQILDFGGAA